MPARRSCYAEAFRCIGSSSDCCKTPFAVATCQAGQMLPTEHELAARHGVSRITVRHALRDLEAEGLVQRSRPKGNVVAGNLPGVGNAWSFDSLQDIVTFAEQTRVRIFSFSQQPAPEDVAAIFGFEEGVELPCVHGMRLLKNEPLSEFHFWITPSVASQLTRDDVSQSTLFSGS